LYKDLTSKFLKSCYNETGCRNVTSALPLRYASGTLRSGGRCQGMS
jgi:hypothetical protein